MASAYMTLLYKLSVAALLIEYWISSRAGQCVGILALWLPCLLRPQLIEIMHVPRRYATVASKATRTYICVLTPANK